MRPLVYLLFLLPVISPLGVTAQDEATRAVRGRVIDAETDEPLAGVHVYLTRTTIGTTTDRDGHYVLDHIPPGSLKIAASMLGYSVEIKRLGLLSGTPATLDFHLKPTVLELGGVEVTATRPDIWYEHLEMFKGLFLGRTPNAPKCDVVNPEMLHFEYDADIDLLHVETNEPLIIENKALGYRLFYHLEAFEAQHGEVRYRGALRFEELEPRNRRERRRWERRRRTAYEGSPQHFLSTVMRANHIRDVHRAGFDVSLVPNFLDDPGYSLPVRSTSFVQPAVDPTHRMLNFSDHLQIIYKPDYREPSSSGIPGQSDNIPIEDYASWITLTDGPAEIDRFGHLFDPYTVTMYGLWSKERVAEALPRDYTPNK